ncbi:hypothetical protein AB1Y20_023568 [Prymnesium parvum]|uniref:ethanolamine kinase n=1 Tax=Prymnesium parvum TaxID=97485 RepID=A0AB34JE37_PRYPA
MASIGDPPIALQRVVAGEEAALEAFARWLVASVPTLPPLPLVPVQGGLNNTTYRLGDVLVKVYGRGTALLTDRARERRLMAHLCAHAAAGTCKALVATFAGGHIEEWLHGTTLPFAALKAPANLAAIARLLARLHACPLPPEDSPLTAAASSTALRAFFDDMSTWAAALPPSLPTPARAPPSPPPTRARLVEEVAWLRGVPAPSAACVAHHDVAPRAFDIANFFLECCFVEESESWDWSLEPTREEKLAFTTAYTDELRSLFDDTTDKEELLAECEAGWPLVAHLWNVLWAMTTAVAQETSPAHTQVKGSDEGSVDDVSHGEKVGGGFDYVAYACERWTEYLKQKDLLRSS